MLRRSLHRLCAGAAAAAGGDKGDAFEEQYRSSGSSMKGGQSTKLSSIHFGVSREKCGSLLEVLQRFQKHGVTLEHIQSREVPMRTNNKVASVIVHAPYTAEDPKMKAILDEMRSMDLPICNVLGSWDIPWFPTCAADLDRLDQNTLAAGADLQDNPDDPHPGFHDQEYRQRRQKIVENAQKYRHGDPLPVVDYSEKENKTWQIVYDKLTSMHDAGACKEYRRQFPRLIESGGYSRYRVAQIGEVNTFLQEETGFTIRPVAGLLSSRDFFNALAFRVFYSTQYIRHHSKPLYTPEPDVVHELLGHAPLFADPDFANFSQEFGLMSLGATDEEIDRLGRLYWYTVEFGLCKEANSVRAYGAGILSSFGELEHALSDKPKKLPWDPWVASELEFPITTYQPTYFVAESFKDAQIKLKQYGASMDKPYKIEYLPATNSVRMWPSKAFE